MAKIRKKRKNKKSGKWFALGMLIYAVVFLGSVAFGLNWFWGYMEAYEASRAYLPIDAYMEELTKEHIVDACADEVLAMVDLNIQSEEECRQYLLDALDEEITYARKASECTDNKQVYVLRCGKQVVGRFSIVTTEADEYGYTPWVFEEESFDLTYLMGTEKVTITVPDGYPVFVNDVELDDSYVIDEVTEEFEVLEEYYEDYELPVFITRTYEAGPFLGEFGIEARDVQGNPFVYDEETYDKMALIENCSAEEVEDLDAFIEEFIDVYVIFAGCANDSRYANYSRVIQYVVRDSNLAKRMADAVEGMQFAQSMGDEVDTIIMNHRVKLEDGRYLCDVTYLVNTTGREGVVQTTSNAKIIVVETNGKLLVESMIAY